MIRPLAAALAAGLLSALLAGAASAHVVSDRELRQVAQLPSKAVDLALAGAVPDAAGLLSPNRPQRWNGVGCQRPALLGLMVAAARADTLGAERAWLALEQGFVHQRANGHFERATALRSPSDEWLEESAWLGSVTRSLIAVMNSRLQDRFRWRYALMKPKLQRSVECLLASSDSLQRANATSGGFLMVMAATFLLADGTYHDERYGRAGQSALAAALALQRADGLFPTNGAPEGSRHALGLESLQSLVLYFPSPSLERAAGRAAQWLRKHRGSIRPRAANRDRSCPETTPGEIEFVLLYAATPMPPPLGPAPHE